MILREKIRRAWTRDVPHLDRYRAPIQDAREAAGHATAWDRFMPLRPDKFRSPVQLHASHCDVDTYEDIDELDTGHAVGLKKPVNKNLTILHDEARRNLSIEIRHLYSFLRPGRAKIFQTLDVQQEVADKMKKILQNLKKCCSCTFGMGQQGDVGAMIPCLD